MGCSTCWERVNGKLARSVSAGLIIGILIIADLAAQGPAYDLLPEESQKWLEMYGQQVLLKTGELPLSQRRHAETRVFDFIERGTGRLIREPERPEEQWAVARHLNLLDEVLAEPVFIQTGRDQVGFIHGSRFGSGTVPVDLGDGRVVLQCVSLRDHLLGKTSPSAFPGFIRWTEE